MFNEDGPDGVPSLKCQRERIYVKRTFTVRPQSAAVCKTLPMTDVPHIHTNVKTKFSFNGFDGQETNDNGQFNSIVRRMPPPSKMESSKNFPVPSDNTLNQNGGGRRRRARTTSRPAWMTDDFSTSYSARPSSTVTTTTTIKRKRGRPKKYDNEEYDDNGDSEDNEDAEDLVSIEDTIKRAKTSASSRARRSSKGGSKSGSLHSNNNTNINNNNNSNNSKGSKSGSKSSGKKASLRGESPLPTPKRRTVTDMVKAGIIKAGNGVLIVSHKGLEYRADLTKSGKIMMNKRLFHTPSALTNFIKQRQDNGWTSVFYGGIKLSDWRDGKT